MAECTLATFAADAVVVAVVVAVAAEFASGNDPSTEIA